MRTGVNEPVVIGYLPMMIIGGTLFWKATADQRDWAHWSKTMPWMPKDEARVAYHSICAIDPDHEHIFLGDNWGRAQDVVPRSVPCTS
ncbi:MAG: hypothetical protein WCG99_03975 [Candidatus Berkelbacteria bacterium]